MIVYVNSKNEIKDVNTTTDETLTPVEVEEGFFDGWSVAKICCFKVFLRDGKFCGFTPYIDSRIIEHIERQGQENINLQSQVDYLAMMTDVEL